MWPILLIAFVVGSAAFTSFDTVQVTAEQLIHRLSRWAQTRFLDHLRALQHSCETLRLLSLRKSRLVAISRRSR